MQDVTRRTVLKVAGGTGLAMSGVGVASANAGPDVRKKLAELREATAKYHDVGVAEEDGYALDPGHCVSHPVEDAAMGYHAVNFAKVDGDLNHTDPEVLVYEKRGGKFHLVAVEFLVVAPEAPTFLGHEMHLFIPADHPENPVGENVWELHAWVWKGNPDGTFAGFNPNVDCPGKGGAP